MVRISSELENRSEGQPCEKLSVRFRRATLVCGTGTSTLRRKTFSGIPFRGTDKLCLVPIDEGPTSGQRLSKK